MEPDFYSEIISLICVLLLLVGGAVLTLCSHALLQAFFPDFARRLRTSELILSWLNWRDSWAVSVILCYFVLLVFADMPWSVLVVAGSLAGLAIFLLVHVRSLRKSVARFAQMNRPASTEPDRPVDQPN
jgi:hypothetical protein